MQITPQEKADVDVRFLLANERTLLAWIRTSLAIEAGGVALTEVHQHHSYIGISVLLLGAIVSLIGYHRFQNANRAIRRHELPSSGIGPTVQVILVVIIAAGLAIAQFTIVH